MSEIFLRNSLGKWATVSWVAPNKVNNVEGIETTVTSAVGLLKISNVYPFIKSDDAIHELTSSMIAIIEQNDEKVLQEFYGVMLFKPLEGLNYKEQISRFISHPSEYETVHPKIVAENIDYVFFAKRSKSTVLKEREKWTH